MRRNGGEFEALGLLRTFVGGPTAAQWAVAGEAPAPRLTDRSRPRPQRGNSRGRQREERAAATRRSDRDFGCQRRQRTAYGAHAHRRGPCRVGPSIFNAEQKNLCGTGIEANTASMISSSGGVAVKAREQREKRRF